MERTGLDVLLSRQEIGDRVRALGHEIAGDHAARQAKEALHLVGILQGAFVFLADLIRAIEVDVTVDFMEAQSYGAGTQSSEVVRITKDLDSEIRDRDVLIVEDIVDTGRTLAHIRELLVRRAPRSVRAVALLDKPARRVVPVDLAYVGFRIPDVFVVGYGLDHAERYRGLPDLRILAREGA
ncbi:MAG: hypoxanthine phosphoribosyltransferase [Planctomycetota bacterium]|jgi:hypoxanthine phosphoribosyltransferase